MQSSIEQRSELQRAPTAKLKRAKGQQNVGDVERVLSSMVGGVGMMSPRTCLIACRCKCERTRTTKQCLKCYAYLEP